MRMSTQITHRPAVPKPLVVRTPAPRNRLVLAVIGRRAKGGTDRHETAEERRARFERLDFDDQVRQIGEW